MRIQPDGINLLDTVTALLRDQVLPSAAADQQYALRMALNAIGIARRQLANGSQAEQQEQALMAELLAEQGSHEQLSRLLARQVREGKVKSSMPLRDLLWQVTLQRVRESAPRYLKQEG
ncbi:DUF6285 domain-containing protein [Alcanivorax sp. 1008]|uniref:DUF6285 domain-containing protein n=1 Tax=Alcanivorax sp. 1008 TaxID=2816853 RepID=UPI001DA1A567|nr:DUF6285 domain-containing protein [Alcanivorax sp. 1008]MCC1497369.1 hypothetical protein [Alcanivorax sp. 1008]